MIRFYSDEAGNLVPFSDAARFLLTLPFTKDALTEHVRDFKALNGRDPMQDDEWVAILLIAILDRLAKLDHLAFLDQKIHDLKTAIEAEEGEGR